MFERFTERARQVVVLGQQAAKDREQNRIDSVALLVGLIDEQEGLASQTLAQLAVERGAVLKAWESYQTAETAPERDAGSQQLPFTGDAHAVLELALREALSLGHNYIGTEHVLLGLARREDSDAAMILHDSFGVNGATVRDEVARKFQPPAVRQAKPADNVTVDLSPGHARALLDYVGRRPHDEKWSKACYDAILKALAA